MMNIHTRPWGAGCMTALTSFLLAATLMFSTSAQASDEWSPGYQYDMRGDVARDAAGNCLRTAQWSPGQRLCSHPGSSSNGSLSPRSPQSTPTAARRFFKSPDL